MERHVCEMTYYVSSGMLNPTHSLTRSWSVLWEHCGFWFGLVFTWPF